ncbi:MAG: methionine synthase [Elusimicrobia bacterium]|nr:methionine synthase [Elusimicrobiota bacterium]
MKFKESAQIIQNLLNERILVLDGAMGTMIQSLSLKPEDFGGHALDGCNEHLNLSKPEAILVIHRAYLQAGCDIIETNSFGSSRIVLAEYGLQNQALEISKAAAILARKTADEFSTPDHPRFVAGSMGPTTKTLSVTGGISFQELLSAYQEQATGLLQGGADILILETTQDTLNLKAGLLGVEEAFQKIGFQVPVMVSVTIETMGTMLAGQGVEALYLALEHRNLLSIGLNCATGPDFMTDHIRTLAGISRFHISCIPNAGLPDEHGQYHETPESLARKLERFADQGWLNLVGGCCGTTPEHIRLIQQMLEGKKPRRFSSPRRSAVSGLEPLLIEEDRRPILVGERTNVIGSRLFKNLILEGKWEEAAEIGRRQIRNGAHILDVCLANPDRDEKTDMAAFISQLVKKVKSPLMIDTTDFKVLEEALVYCQGKCVVNSINLEDGEERFQKVVPLIRQYGTAVVVGTIDEDKQQGMAVTWQRKLEIALRSHKLLTEKYGLREEDLYFDVLVFPVGTGDKNYYGSAIQTIEGLRAVKKALPLSKTILGISNVSFGLPLAGREVLNAVFLHHCVEAGLDLAIVNAEKLARYSTLPEEDKRIAEQILFWKGPQDPDFPKDFDAIAEFSAHFKERKETAPKQDRKKLPVEERLAQCVVEGSKEGLLEDLEELLARKKPLEIINGPLMKGMDQVGRLFAANEMIVAEVLQSAEAMKAAVAYLEPRMDKSDSYSKAKIILATVKGDVHDIGKNLVHIILKNNGYEVVDLGIKVAPETLIEAARRERPTLIGLSGLLVKSAQQMVATVEDLKSAGISTPVLVGGAALSPKFTASRIAPTYGNPVAYAKDAMHGLDIANQLTDSRKKNSFLKKNQELQLSLSSASSIVVEMPSLNGASERKITYNHLIPTPPDLKLHALDKFDIEKIFSYINPIMLYGKHLGLKGNLEQRLKDKDSKATELLQQMTELQNEVLAKGLLKAKAVFRFFPTQAEADSLSLYKTPDGKESLETFTFPRQSTGERLCLADFVLPKDMGMDYTALFVVTCGSGIPELSTRLREKGEYFKSHALQALAIESAEAFAELLHEKIRQMWGIGDPPNMTLREKFQAKYRGLRVSFGYPACPNLEDQVKLFKLLQPEKNAGVRLTEGFMMEPEASVSALVLHHPEARYFSVGTETISA